MKIVNPVTENLDCKSKKRIRKDNNFPNPQAENFNLLVFRQKNIFNEKPLVCNCCDYIFAA